ncbi:MAG: hypothetical protein BWY45_03107 [Euryarchaeota archaeon ADurb.Bin294]|nr:MAG: hypothetical protein BWY45_03107 [Euryarchaeota archaeon ADurb.Bin294]
MKQPSEIFFADEKTAKRFHQLKEGTHEEKFLYNLISKKIDELSQDAIAGKQIKKACIPKHYRLFDNLWKIDLNDRWRLIYTILTDDQGRISLIIDWLDHKEYEKLLNYRVK